MPLTYGDKVRGLRDLESFRKEAFVGDRECPQAVCNLVLALALLHNDMNDIYLGLELLADAPPTPPLRRSKEWALHNALGLHLVRQRAGCVHEMIALVRDNLSVLTEPYFVSTYRTLSSKQRDSWDVIVTVARDKPKDTPLGKALLLMRNKIAFHYDAARIGQGYLKLLEEYPNEPALLCRGTNAHETRFCFADAAAETALFIQEDFEVAKGLAFGNNKIFDDLNLAIYHLVTKFILRRGGSFRAYSDDGTIPLPSVGTD